MRMSRQDLVQRIQDRGGGEDILDEKLVIRTCKSSWSRLQRLVQESDSYIEDIYGPGEGDDGDYGENVT